MAAHWQNLIASNWEKDSKTLVLALFGDFCAYKSHPGGGAGEAPSSNRRVRGRVAPAISTRGLGVGTPHKNHPDLMGDPQKQKTPAAP